MFPPILISQSSLRSRHGICSVAKNTYAYKIKLYENQTSLEYIIKLHIKYMFFPLLLPTNATRGGTMPWIFPVTKSNVFIFHRKILCLVKNFAPHVDHIMQNEIAQIVDYIQMLSLVQPAIMFLRVNLQLLDPG